MKVEGGAWSGAGEVPRREARGAEECIDEGLSARQERPSGPSDTREYPRHGPHGDGE